MVMAKQIAIRGNEVALFVWEEEEGFVEVSGT